MKRFDALRPGSSLGLRLRRPLSWTSRPMTRFKFQREDVNASPEGRDNNRGPFFPANCCDTKGDDGWIDAFAIYI